MPTDAQKKANYKYQSNKSRIVIWCDPEEKKIIEQKAAAAGKSVNAFIKDTILSDHPGSYQKEGKSCQ